MSDAYHPRDFLSTAAKRGIGATRSRIFYLPPPIFSHFAAIERL
jgi:hypothetical protein